MLSPAAHAGGPTMLVGADEDAVKQSTMTAAKAKLDLLKLAGFNAVRVTAIWQPGQTQPPTNVVDTLRNLTQAANLDGFRVYVAVYSAGSKTTPLSDADQAAFASFTAGLAQNNPDLTDFVIGNEPNLNRFWLPQFNPDGSDAAAPAYEALLARTYDALKAVSPSIDVIGGAISPRGVDKPNTGRDTHSPTQFILDMGAAYRASGRTTPIMDALSIHTYGENASVPPTFTHPNTTPIGTADYPKLVGLLATAFDGTAQPGSTLPIVYGEYGVESQIPPAEAALYTGTELSTTKPVDEQTQGEYYSQALALAFCQPTVKAIFLFHAFDEQALDRFQSGVYYADGTPKASLPMVQGAARSVRGGVIAKCPGLALTPTAKAVFPLGRALSRPPVSIRLTCDIDCNYYARLEKAATHSTTFAVYGRALSGMQTAVVFPKRRVAPGRYRFTLRLTAPLNTGPSAVLISSVLTLR
jgi:hypothetical protein